MTTWALVRRIRRPPGCRDVRTVHRWQPTRIARWLDDTQRHLILPLALWDVADQLMAAAELDRLRPGR
jgi:hypothetical protein